MDPLQREPGDWIRGRRVYSLEGIELPGEVPMEERTGGPAKCLLARSGTIRTVPAGLLAVAAGDGEEEGEDDGRGQSFNILSLGPSSSVASGDHL